MKKLNLILIILLVVFIFILFFLYKSFSSSSPTSLSIIPSTESVSEITQAFNNNSEHVYSSTIYSVLPEYCIDASSHQYQPVVDKNFGGSRWVILSLDDQSTYSLYYFFPKWDLSIDITNQPENGFDSSLGKKLIDYSVQQNHTPLFYILVGQRWLVSCDSNKDLIMYGYSSENEKVIYELQESIFLKKYWCYISGKKPLPTGSLIQ